MHLSHQLILVFPLFCWLETKGDLCVMGESPCASHNLRIFNPPPQKWETSTLYYKLCEVDKNTWIYGSTRFEIISLVVAHNSSRKLGCCCLMRGDKWICPKLYLIFLYKMVNYIENINDAKLKPQSNFTFLRKDDPRWKIGNLILPFLCQIKKDEG